MIFSNFYTYISHTRYSWTSDPNHSRLTGETRLCYHMYVAYKVEQDENGKYVLIPSPDVEDLTTVMDEYPYIKKTYVKIVTSDGKEASYEDGKQEDMSEEEKRRAEEYDSTRCVEPTAQSQFHPGEKGMSLVKRYTYRT